MDLRNIRKNRPSYLKCHLFHVKFSNDISITIFQSVAKWYMYHLHFFLFNFLPSPRRIKHRNGLPDWSLCTNQDFCFPVTLLTGKLKQICTPWFALCSGGGHSGQSTQQRVQQMPEQSAAPRQFPELSFLCQRQGYWRLAPGSICGSLPNDPSYEELFRDRRECPWGPGKLLG